MAHRTSIQLSQPVNHSNPRRSWLDRMRHRKDRVTYDSMTMDCEQTSEVELLSARHCGFSIGRERLAHHHRERVGKPRRASTECGRGERGTGPPMGERGAWPPHVADQRVQLVCGSRDDVDLGSSVCIGSVK